MSTMWNGCIVHVVPSGEWIADPTGKKPPIVVSNKNIAVVGHRIYCTESTEKKIIAKIEAMIAKRGAR